MRMDFADVFTITAVTLTVLSGVAYIGASATIDRSSFIVRHRAGAGDFTGVGLQFRTACRLGMYRSQFARAKIYQDRLVFTCRGPGYIGDYSVRRDSVDGIHVGRTPVGTRLRVVRDGRPSLLVTLWVYDDAGTWELRLAELGWLVSPQRRVMPSETGEEETGGLNLVDR